MKVRLVLVVSIFLVIFTSCTITKRHYTGGYQIEWNKHYLTQKRAEFSDDELFLANQKDFQENHSEKDTLPEVEPSYKDEEENVLNDIRENKAKQGTESLFLVLKKSYLNDKLNSSKQLVNKNIDDHIKPDLIGSPGLRTPREYLVAALWLFIIGVVLVGIFALFLIVFEIEGLSIGGLFIYFLFLIGAGCIIATPIALLFALFAFLVYL